MNNLYGRPFIRRLTPFTKNTLEQYGANRQYRYDGRANNWRTTMNNTTGFSMYNRPLTEYFTSSTIKDNRRRAYYSYESEVVYPWYDDPYYYYTRTTYDYIPAVLPKIRAIFVPTYCSPWEQLFGNSYRLIHFLSDRSSRSTDSSSLGTKKYPPADQQKLVNLSTISPLSNFNYQFPQLTFPIYPIIPKMQEQPYAMQSTLQYYQPAAQPFQYNYNNYQPQVNSWGVPSSSVSQLAITYNLPRNDSSVIAQCVSCQNGLQFSIPSNEKPTFTSIFSPTLPPLPPGAIVISDEYFENAENASIQQKSSKKKRKHGRYSRRLAKPTIKVKPHGKNKVQLNQVLSPGRTSAISDDWDSPPSHNHEEQQQPTTNLVDNQEPAANSNDDKENELRDLRLSLVTEDNTLDLSLQDSETIPISIIQDEELNHPIPSPTISESKKANTHIIPIREIQRRSRTPSKVSSSHKDSNFDSLSLQTLSQSDEQSQRNPTIHSD